MKNMLLAIVFASSLVHAKTYEEVREEFKERMYKSQENFGMGREEYFAFIEPKLVEAEKEIFVEQLEYIKKNPDSEIGQQFLGALLIYNAVSFGEYVCPTDAARNAKAYHKIKLQEALTALEKTKGSKVDVSNPGMKANWGERFVDDANVEFYKQLPAATRLKLAFGCLASKWK